MRIFWKDWLAIRRIWWVQLLYSIVILASYSVFGYILACIWILESPTLSQVLLLGVGSFLALVGILISIVDCVLLYCRRSEDIHPTSLEPIQILVEAPIQNPMSSHS